MSPIGTLRENSLHAALKQTYAQPGDQLEAWVDGFWIDIQRGETLIEIQTGNFSSIRRKLERLLETHPVRLVYPIAREKWIVRITADRPTEEVLARRRSPRKGRWLDVFEQVVYLPKLVLHPGFTLEVWMIQQEDIWLDDGHGSWRRKGVSVVDRRLVGVLDRKVFTAPEEYLSLLPANLSGEFTARQAAALLGLPMRRAQRVIYTLREMGALQAVGKRGRAMLYQKRRPDLGKTCLE